RLEPSSSMTRSVEAGTDTTDGVVADDGAVAPARPLPDGLGLAESSLDEHPTTMTAMQTVAATSASVRRPHPKRARANPSTTIAPPGDRVHCNLRRVCA